MQVCPTLSEHTGYSSIGWYMWPRSTKPVWSRWAIFVAIAKNTLYRSSPNTNDLYIHYMDKSTGTPSLEEKKTLPNCGNKDGNIILYLNLYFHLCCNSFEMTVSICTSHWCLWWVCGSFKVTPEVFSCFLQTSQVLPHWLNHHFSLILVLYTETLSC